MRLWDLPGARRFVESVCESLRAGNNVVASFPSGIPDGFDNAVSVTIGNAFYLFDLCATNAPLDDLRQYTDQPTHVHSAADLCDDAGFRGRLIRPLGLNACTWPAWRHFLSAYAQASRSRPLDGRSLFLLAGCPVDDTLPEEVGVVDLPWDGSVDDVDLLLFASERLRGRADDPLVRSLLAHTVAQVAAWDFDSAATLVAENDETIMDPTEILRAIAKERGWTADTPLDWRFGTASRGGVAHPARAAIEDPPRELERRLWSAQLTVLLPWIEVRRHGLVADNLYEVRRQMSVVGNGEDDPYDLEVGDLFMLFDRRGGHRGIRRAFKSLRDGRNELAHRSRLLPERILKLIGPSPRQSGREL